MTYRRPDQYEFSATVAGWCILLTAILIIGGLLCGM